MLYGFDPGLTTGYAMATEEGKLIDFGQLSIDDLLPFINKITDASVFVVENFLIEPGRNFAFDDMKTIRIIGMLQFRAFQLGCSLALQPRTVKGTGYRWAGITVPKEHSLSHQTDAYAHLTYYSVKVLGHLPPASRHAEALNTKGK